MASTIRLSAELSKRAGVYARTVGITMNGLVAVALDEFLRAREAPRAVAPGPGIAGQVAQVEVKPGQEMTSRTPAQSPGTAIPLTRQQRREAARQARKGR